MGALPLTGHELIRNEICELVDWTGAALFPKRLLCRVLGCYACGTIETVRENGMSASVVSSSERRLLLRVLLWAAVLCALSVAFKYLVVEQQAIAAICESDAPAWWCQVRESIIVFFYNRYPAIASLALAIVALLLGGHRSARYWAILAIILAAPSIVLWGADYAAPAFLLGLIRLLRG